jgi:hypothetical protein
MPKIKPILIFIIASVALHWWVLSLPIFKKIQTLEINQGKPPTQTLLARLNEDQEPIKHTEKEQSQISKTGAENTEELRRVAQQQPPSFLRGSPWMRRPVENFNGNNFEANSETMFAQIEIKLQNELPLDQQISYECRRSGIDRNYICKSSGPDLFSDKIASNLNQLTTSYPRLADCLALEVQQKKWHAKACHS